MKWCLILLSWESDGTAVPIFISLKNCLESAEIISQLNFSAKSIEISVLPTQVGPSTTIRKLFFVLVQVINIFEVGKGLFIISIKEKIINFWFNLNIYIIIIVIRDDNVVV